MRDLPSSLGIEAVPEEGGRVMALPVREQGLAVRLRTAEQHLHAERVQRAELEQRLAVQARESDRELAALHERVRDLERERRRMRRQVDEAQHLAVVAQAVRARAYAAIELVRAELERIRANVAASAAARGGPPDVASAAARGGPPDAASAPAPGAPPDAASAAARGGPPDAASVAAPDAPPEAAHDPPAVGKRRHAGTAGPVQAERLSAALARLRESSPPAPAASEAVDVELRVDGGASHGTQLATARVGRPRRGRWWRRRVALRRGDRRRLAAADRLVRARLTLQQLHAAGVRPDPAVALTVAAFMIEPGWTVGERFTIGHREPPAPAPGAYLHIRDGRVPIATAKPPQRPVTTILVCPQDALLAALAGAPSAEVAIEGEARPWALIGQWLERAQSG